MRIPRATYRLQFTPQFTFESAEKIIDYLVDLGISDIYASPIFKAKKGSLHGYDVVDPLQINPELGGQEIFERVNAVARAKGLGWLQDIVPNHMAYDSDNRMLMDILENGTASKYFHFFDIEFNHPYDNLNNKILAPFLGEFYGQCVDKNQIQLEYTENGFFIRYFDFIFPLNIGSYLRLLTTDLHFLTERLGVGHEDMRKFMEITQLLKGLSSVMDFQERIRQIILLKTWLWQLYSHNQQIRDYLNQVLAKINTKRQDASFNMELDRLMQEQYFRLSFWKVGNEELNYRRFFTVNSFVCLCMSRPEVFEYTHRLISKLVLEEKFTGLRIDHIDGLYDPQEYLKSLRTKTNGTYVVAEKILDLDEELPTSFDLQGTTGYDFLNFCNGVFVDSRAERRMLGIFNAYIDKEIFYDQLVLDKKQLFIGKHMAGDIDNLAHLLRKIVNRNPYGKDLTMYGLRRALVLILAQFPVYRTYVAKEEIRPEDRTIIEYVMARARNANPGAIYELDAIEKILLLNFDTDMQPQEKSQWLHFVKRIQQFTGPLTAKALEDTAFYVYNPLISLNEVGGNPSRFGMTIEEFHAFNSRRQKHWPLTMNATATHDTKRGEDVRSRINILSENPLEWHTAVKAWCRINRTHKQQLKHMTAPDKDDEYFIYQTLVGALPFEETATEEFKIRMKEYVIKAIREAKVHTAWIKPDEAYENACKHFIERILDSNNDTFLPMFRTYQKNIAHYAIYNSLSQVALKMTSVGIPDFYQGCELWDFALVDPDNRRPVDYDRRKIMLDTIKAKLENKSELIKFLWQERENGAIKLYLIHELLKLRRRRREVFEQGDYIPLKVTGAMSHHILAYARHIPHQWIITVVPRFISQLTKDNSNPALGDDVWSDTVINFPEEFPKQWNNVLTNETIASTPALKPSQVFSQFPVGILVNS